MTKIKRRAFIKLIRDASVWTLAPCVMGNTNMNVPPLMRYATVDLDQADHYATELQNHFQKGNVRHVLKEASRYCNMLKQLGFPVNVICAAEVQMRFSMLFASAQECTLPWFERAASMIRIYDQIEAEVLSKLPIQSQYSYHIQLLARRAPLYREMGIPGKSLEQFTLALNKCLRKTDNIESLVELYYSRAHVWAVLGDERRWQLDLSRAKEYSQQADHVSKKNLSHLITYTEGEGYKRLAYNTHLNLPHNRRVGYAEQGITCFKQSHLEESPWVGHAILNGVAEAQCLILIDPVEAIYRAKNLRQKAHQIYPSIAQKIEHTIDIAQKRLQ